MRSRHTVLAFGIACTLGIWLTYALIPAAPWAHKFIALCGGIGAGATLANAYFWWRRGRLERRARQYRELLARLHSNGHPPRRKDHPE